MTELEQRVNEILYREMEPLRPTHADDWSKLITAEILSLFGYPLAEGEKLAVVKEGGKFPEPSVSSEEAGHSLVKYNARLSEYVGMHLMERAGRTHQVVRILE